MNPRRAAPTWREFSVPGALLQPSGNVLAVELHQAGALPSYPAAVLASGPVVYWRLDESSAESGAVSDLAQVAGAPEQGEQNGTAQGFAAANWNCRASPTDSIGGRPCSVRCVANAAPSFQGNNGRWKSDVIPRRRVLNFAPSGNKFAPRLGAVRPAQESGAPVFEVTAVGRAVPRRSTIFVYVRDPRQPRFFST
jgi:hypothetical protein